MSQASRQVSLLGAVAIGIGGMVGGGIFAVLGEAVELARGGTVMAFAIAGVVTALTTYCYSKLSVAIPSRGGTISFIDSAFGRNLLSGSANGMLWLSYLVTIALYAVAFGSYTSVLLPGNPGGVVRHLLISLGIILPAVINVFSARSVSRTETIVVVVKLAILAVVVAFGASRVDLDRIGPSQWSNPLSLVVSGMVIFVAYEGFELISNTAEDIRNPKKSLPLAYGLSVGIVIVLYLVIAAITVSAVSTEQIARAKDYALAVAAQPSLGQVGFILVAIAAILATFSAINASIYGNARLGYILAVDGELPQFQERERHGVPAVGAVTIAVISLLLANLVQLQSIAIIASASFLLIFSIVNAAAVKMGARIHARRWITIPATIISTISLITLLWHSAQSDPLALGVFGGFLTVSIAIELGYGRLVRGHFLGRPYPSHGTTHPKDQC